jgi:hypothetical protein
MKNKPTNWSAFLENYSGNAAAGRRFSPLRHDGRQLSA